MASITFTRKNMLEALAVKEHILRKWVDVLPPYAQENTEERHSRKYTGSDLLFFLIVKDLIETYGMNLNTIAKFSQNLTNFLLKPLSVSSPGCLRINLLTTEVSIALGSTAIGPIVLLSLDEPLKNYRLYLGYPIDEPQQTSLAFGLEMLGGRKSR